MQTTEPIQWEQIEVLLHRVQRPGRYVGGEYNAIHKSWDDTDTHVCLAFPDLYDLGMSNFALLIFYELLNQQPDVLAERTYLPAPDMTAALRSANLPLYSLESYRPVSAFDILAISTAYEHLYTNTLELLDLAGLPIHSAERDARHPLIIGGGHGTFNPEPITDFFDAFVIGEGEDILLEIVETLRSDFPAEEGDHISLREAQLRALLQIPGLYVPRFYRTLHTSKGAHVEPATPEAPARIQKRLMGTLPPTPVRQLVPNIDVVHNRAVVEIQRGCTHGCRFCQAGSITRPVRERSADEIEQSIVDILDATGYEEVALLSLSSADHTEIAPLLNRLLDRFADRAFGKISTSVSLPSLRVDSLSIDLADILSQGRRSGFTQTLFYDGIAGGN